MVTFPSEWWRTLERNGWSTCVGIVAYYGAEYPPTYKKGDKGKYQLVVSDKSWKNLKDKLKAATRKTSPLSFPERIQKLKEIQQGWINYFRIASLTGKLKELDS